MQDAVRLAQSQLAVRPDDTDVQYQLGASSGLLALYRGTVEGRTLAAFTEGRRAVAIMERIRERDSGHREAALLPGIYRYAVSTLSWPKRMLAAAAGMAGDGDGGIRLLETAASEPAETATDAASGKGQQARVELEAAVSYGRRAGDRLSMDIAERLRRNRGAS